MDTPTLIRETRETLGVSQATLSKRAAVPRRSLDRYERSGKGIDPCDFFSIIRVLQEAYRKNPINDSKIFAFLADPGGLGVFDAPSPDNGPGGGNRETTKGESHGKESDHQAHPADAQTPGLVSNAHGEKGRNGGTDVCEYGESKDQSEIGNGHESACRIGCGKQEDNAAFSELRSVYEEHAPDRLLSGPATVGGPEGELVRLPKISGAALAQLVWLKKLDQQIGRQSIRLKALVNEEGNSEKAIETLYDALYGYDLSARDKCDFARRYSNCAGKPGEQKARGVLVEVCALKGFFGRPPATHAEWKKAANKARQVAHRYRPTVVCERRKPQDAELQKCWKALWAVLGPLITLAQIKGPRQDVKEDFKKTSYRKSLATQILRQSVLRDKCTAAWSAASQKEISFPCLSQILIKLKDHYGHANRYLEMKHHVREMVPQKVERYAQLWSLDCTGIDVHVGHAWEQPSQGRQQRFGYARVDCYSGEIDVVALQCGNEHAGWKEAANRHCDKSDVVPEEILTDKGGKLVNGFAKLEPGMSYEEIICYVAEGILTWVAAGSKPSHHMAERPQGKAFCERNLGLHKDDLHAMIDAHAMALQVEGKLPSNQRRRFFPNESSFQEILKESVEYRNSDCKNFRESQLSRAELAAESKANTDLIRMIPQARLSLIERKREVRVLSAHGPELYDASGQHRATLNTPLSIEDASAPDGIIVILPGLRQGDSKECLRCLAVRNRSGKGLPKFTLYEGLRATRNAAGFPSNAVDRGIFKLRPETESEKKLTVREEEMKEFVAQLPAAQIAAAAPASNKKAVHLTETQAPHNETLEEIARRKLLA
jgi:hypothetical protein